MTSTFTRRNLLLAAGSIAVAAVGAMALDRNRTSTAAATGDYPSYATLDDLVAASDAVVVAQYRASRESLLRPDVSTKDSERNPQQGTTPSQAELDQMAVPITLSTVRIVQTIKGSPAAGQEVEVSQPGRVGQESPSTPLLGEFADRVPNRTFVLFLARQGDGFDIVNPTQGIYGIDVQGTLLALDASSKTTTAALRPGTTTTLTLQQLEALAR